MICCMVGDDEKVDDEFIYGMKMNARSLKFMNSEKENIRLKHNQTNYLNSVLGQKMMQQRRALPTYPKKQEILSLIQNNKVI